jgi:hypothetical protein
VRRRRQPRNSAGPSGGDPLESPASRGDLRWLIPWGFDRSTLTGPRDTASSDYPLTSSGRTRSDARRTHPSSKKVLPATSTPPRASHWATMRRPSGEKAQLHRPRPS